ncbi:MAG TPA: sigma-70 family RNA polymerase sigma factor [Acidimicrobiia bacterium]|nr:sigma-70 family RNA polymerase sigma factor [Acidimicrobiia bacterium]
MRDITESRVSSLDDLCGQLAHDVDAAFPSLVKALQHDLYSGLRRLQPADAEDLTQEVFIRAYRALKEYDPNRIRELRLRTWMWTIALNLGRNRARDRARRPVPVPLEDRHGSSDPETPDNQAWDRRLAALPHPQRRAVVLRHVAGLSNSEIAEALGRPEGTVKADIHRGLQRLRTIMEGE